MSLTSARHLGAPVAISFLLAVSAGAQLRWSDGLRSTLEEVSGCAAAHDSARGSLVLFGGRDARGVAQDWTWQWNGVAWQPSYPAVRPVARFSARAVFDPVRNRVVLFGGEGNATGLVYGDTWEFDGATWTQRTFATAPGARTDHNLVWDAGRSRAVLHGGTDPTGRVLGDTWEYDGVSWIPRITGSSGPQERTRHAMAYDAARRRVVLYGGRSATAGSPVANDLWEWDGGSWTSRTTGNLPPGRFDAELAYDPRSSTLHLYGGEINVTRLDEHWELQGSQWTQRTNPPGRRAGHRMLYVPNEGVCAVGGFGDGGYRRDLVRWTGTRWMAWPATTGSVSAAALARLSATNELVLFGGFSSGSFYGGTWIFEAGADEWTLLSLASTPSARSKHAFAGHPTRNELVLFGGTDGTPKNDTWIFNGTTWSQVNVPTLPGRRQGHALAFHPPTQRYVSFSGRGSSGYWTDTLSFDGSTWTIANPTFAPSARTEYALAYDATISEILLFGGADASGARLDDTWSWNGMRWIHRVSPQRPPARSGASLTWDERRSRLVLFGGSSASGELGDTWEWNGANWLQRQPASAPSPRSLHAATYDAVRGAVAIHGGQAFAPAVFYDTTHWLDVTQVASVSELGATCSPTARLTADSGPCIGASAFTLRLRGVTAAMPSLLVIDTPRPSIAIGSCTLYAPGFEVQITQLVDPNGAARFAFPIPFDPVLVGGVAHAQGFGLDPVGPLLGLLQPSQGLRLSIGE
ncbi:MAG: hypothetical protein IPN34_13785 [Planctomycetes bacterium]|nr:hypothetical protein [Planctomycetota bacterium]